MNERYQKILGLGNHSPTTEWVCFLPWVSEFGWYIMNHVKRIHGYNHHKKIVCVKPGHECLFPTASKFFYDWKDVRTDGQKAGVLDHSKNQEIIDKITKEYGPDITFLYPSETSWEEKTSLASHTFIPKPLHNHDFNVDIVITPRFRQLERTRNYRYWHSIATRFTRMGYKVGICGHKESSFSDIEDAEVFSWDYIDVDTDVELMLKSKVVITQESGLAYLAMMCKKPIIYIDKCHHHVADAHLDPTIPFYEIPGPWNNPDKLIKVVKSLCK